MDEPDETARSESELFLIVRGDGIVWALPAGQVVETMRPMPVKEVPGAPAMVLGAAVIRGEVTPVVAMEAIAGGEREEMHRRLVVMRTGSRRVALAVSEVVGIRRLGAEVRKDMPPLLRQEGSEEICAVAAVDRELMLVLESGRLVPESVWSAMGNVERGS